MHESFRKSIMNAVKTNGNLEQVANAVINASIVHKVKISKNSVNFILKSNDKPEQKVYDLIESSNVAHLY